MLRIPLTYYGPLTLRPGEEGPTETVPVKGRRDFQGPPVPYVTLERSLVGRGGDTTGVGGR